MKPHGERGLELMALADSHRGALPDPQGVIDEKSPFACTRSRTDSSEHFAHPSAFKLQRATHIGTFRRADPYFRFISRIFASGTKPDPVLPHGDIAGSLK